jgi:hypothetical protein
VGVIIGVAFGGIVDSLVKDILTPIIGLFGGQPDLSALKLGPVAVLTPSTQVPASPSGANLDGVVHTAPGRLAREDQGQVLLDRCADCPPQYEPTSLLAHLEIEGREMWTSMDGALSRGRPLAGGHADRGRCGADPDTVHDSGDGRRVARRLERQLALGQAPHFPSQRNLAAVGLDREVQAAQLAVEREGESDPDLQRLVVQALA